MSKRQTKAYDMQSSRVSCFTRTQPDDSSSLCSARSGQSVAESFLDTHAESTSSYSPCTPAVSPNGNWRRNRAASESSTTSASTVGLRLDEAVGELENLTAQLSNAFKGK